MLKAISRYTLVIIASIFKNINVTIIFDRIVYIYVIAFDYYRVGLFYNPHIPKCGIFSKPNRVLFYCMIHHDPKIYTR